MKEGQEVGRRKVVGGFDFLRRGEGVHGWFETRKIVYRQKRPRDIVVHGRIAIIVMAFNDGEPNELSGRRCFTLSPESATTRTGPNP